MDRPIDKRYVLTAVQLIGPIIAIWAMFQYFTLLWFVASLVMFFLMRMIGGSLFYHHIHCHRTHSVHPIIEYIGTALGFYGSLIPPAEFCITHFNHHKYADTDLDPHPYGKQGWRTLFPILWNVNDQVDFKSVIRLRRNKVVTLFSDKYWVLVALPLLLLLFSLPAFLFLFLIPCTLSIWSASISTMNHDENGPINRGFWYGIVSGAEHMHKNHHDHPTDTNEQGWIVALADLIFTKRVKT